MDRQTDGKIERETKAYSLSASGNKTTSETRVCVIMDEHASMSTKHVDAALASSDAFWSNRPHTHSHLHGYPDSHTLDQFHPHLLWDTRQFCARTLNWPNASLISTARLNPLPGRDAGVSAVDLESSPEIYTVHPTSHVVWWSDPL